MGFVRTPMRGMNDFLPENIELREHVMNVIKQTYREFGYTQIETPCVEHIENLIGSHSGENEKLIFKILKRGAKLNVEDFLKNGCDESDLVDSGLRYDLTVPLCRYFSNNFQSLCSPFKALQIGNVWRADRPQKGRFRQFVQCDIDIIGDETLLAEVDLLAAAVCTLTRLGFKNFKIKINDRRILKAIIKKYGLNDVDFNEICVILDKLDKIGFNKIKEELVKISNDVEKIDSLVDFLSNNCNTNNSCKEVCGENFDEFLDKSVIENVDRISDLLKKSSQGFEIVFDPTLVRGLGYYTSTIFEIVTDCAEFSIAGGGRYDDMIGNFLNNKSSIPSCGISIGFERIIHILKSRQDNFCQPTDKIVYLVDKDIPNDELLKIYSNACKQRENGTQVLIVAKKKNIGHQKEMLAKQGYTKFF